MLPTETFAFELIYLYDNHRAIKIQDAEKFYCQHNQKLYKGYSRNHKDFLDVDRGVKILET